MQFVPGASLGQTAYYDVNSASTSDIPVTVGWSASDASGICGYNVWEDRAYEDPYLIYSRTSRTSYTTTTSDYTNQWGSGGGGWLSGITVDAYDCAGNVTSKEAWSRPEVVQENGATFSNYQHSVALSYKGTWSTSNCTCYNAGHTRMTTAAGASVTISFQGPTNTAIAIAMEKSSNRGRFTVYLDGVNRGIVDTYRSTTAHRVIVWAGRTTGSGGHTLRLVNQGTAGRPRIDLDSVLVN
jgi:hypothetical protein